MGSVLSTACDRHQLASQGGWENGEWLYLLAGERTYAAWVRTGLAALASGIGARALLKDVVFPWLSTATGTVLILFSAFCFVAAVWREMGTGAPPLRPDIKRLPAALLLGLNGFLMLLSLAALVGIWTARS